MVVDQSGTQLRVAVIARINRAGRTEWCLPKGHLEGEETAAEAAVREISEETGINGEIIAPLGLVDYWFAAEGRRIHKQVHHFLLNAIGGHLTIENDPDHEAIDVAWVPIDELQALLAFPNERRIAREALARLRRDAEPATEPTPGTPAEATQEGENLTVASPDHQNPEKPPTNSGLAAGES